MCLLRISLRKVIPADYPNWSAVLDSHCTVIDTIPTTLLYDAPTMRKLLLDLDLLLLVRRGDREIAPLTLTRQ